MNDDWNNLDVKTFENVNSDKVEFFEKSWKKSYKKLTSIWIWFQAIGNALCATGFGESIAGLLSENEVPNPLIERSIAAFVIVMLTLINFAGVKWVIRLQFLLLGILVLGAMDFGIGSFTHTNEGKKILMRWKFLLLKTFFM